MRIIFFHILFFYNFLTRSTVKAACTNGWLEEGEFCYYIGHQGNNNQLFTWYEAKDWCLQHGAHLATIETQHETDMLFNTTSAGDFVGNLWLGLNKLSGDRKEFKWTDGSPSAFRSWASDEPNENNFGMCVSQITQHQANCVRRLQGVSTIKGLFNTIHDTLPGVRFRFPFMNMPDAENVVRCERECLAVPACQSYTLISQSSPDFTWRCECLGVNDAQQVREPDPYALSGVRSSCDDTGKWFVSNCGVRNGFLCKRRVGGSELPIIEPTSPPPQGYCPSGYFEGILGKCYHIVEKGHNEGLTWSDAVRLCRTGPGVNPDIASIHSVEDNAVIAMNLPDFTRGLWIGLHMPSANSPWTWADNSPAKFYNWAITPVEGRIQCVQLWTEPGKHAGWTAVTCTTISGYICQTYKDGTILTPPITLPHSCPQNYINHANICYRRLETLQTREEAASICKADGATLVSIHSEQESASLVLLAGSLAPFWIGFKMNVDFEWTWDDDWPVMFTGWESGKEPDSLDQCALYQPNSKWMAEDCSKRYHSVCRISTAPPPSTPAVIDGYCPDNWMGYGSDCYFFTTFNDGQKSWEDAQRDCLQRSSAFGRVEGDGEENQLGGLVSIHHQAENQFIYEELKSRQIAQAWIGLHKEGHESPHYWTDGTSLDYARWAPGEPNDKVGAQLCVEMYITLYPGLWNDHICSERRSYVCKAPKAPAPPPTPFSPPGLKCPEGCQWKSRGQFCYYVDLNTRLNFDSAQQACVKLAGHTARLAHIPDMGTNLFLLDTVRQETTMSARIWIGLARKNVDEGFKWMNGSALNFSNWDVGEPNNQNDENCVELVAPSGMWNDMNCVTNSLAFICQVKKEDLALSDGISQKYEPENADYELSHGGMAGVVIGTILCTLFVALLVFAIYYFVTGNTPEVLERMTQQKYPPVKRKSTVENANSR